MGSIQPAAPVGIVDIDPRFPLKAGTNRLPRGKHPVNPPFHELLINAEHPLQPDKSLHVLEAQGGNEDGTPTDSRFQIQAIQQFAGWKLKELRRQW